MSDFSKGRISRAGQIVTLNRSSASTASPHAGSISSRTDAEDCVATFYHDNARSTLRPNSLRGARYLALHETLLTLSAFPEGHDFHLDPEVALRASNYLAVISKNLDIDPPRFFPQDGEAAIFTWDLGIIKRLFTVDADEIDIMDVNRYSMMRCDHSLPDDEASQLGALLEELGGQHLISSSTSMDGDA